MFAAAKLFKDANKLYSLITSIYSYDVEETFEQQRFFPGKQIDADANACQVEIPVTHLNEITELFDKYNISYYNLNETGLYCKGNKKVETAILNVLAEFENTHSQTLLKFIQNKYEIRKCRENNKYLIKSFGQQRE